MREQFIIKNTLSAGFDSIPPTALVMFAVVAIQLGAAISVSLFPLLGVDGTVAVRIILSACLLLMFSGASIKALLKTAKAHWPILVVFGFCIVAMNLFFYEAINRIPLGAAVAIEFIGPLGVAAFNAKRTAHLLWVALAALGVLLLSPLSGAALDTLGIIYALMAGAGWAMFILLATKVGGRISGNDGLAIGMTIAAVIMLPMGLPTVPTLLSSPWVLLASAGVALLSTTIPFTCEFQALKRLPARAYGILVSMEPAVAALVGAILLAERIGLQGLIAVGCVVAAAIGITLSDNKSDQA